MNRGRPMSMQTISERWQAGFEPLHLTMFSIRSPEIFTTYFVVLFL
jgi:hypothetical protein